MNRQNLIDRLVANQLRAAASAKAGCVPCFGSANRAFCLPAAQPKK